MPTNEREDEPADPDPETSAADEDVEDLVVLAYEDVELDDELVDDDAITERNPRLGDDTHMGDVD